MIPLPPSRIMAVCCKSMLFLVFFCFSCFVVKAEVSPDKENLLPDFAGKGVETTSQPSTSSEYETQAFALPGKTPEICPSTTHQCGFQLYDQYSRQPIQAFIEYCKCPAGSHCVKTGDNKNMQFFSFRCKEKLEEDDETIPKSHYTVETVPDELIQRFGTTDSYRGKKETIYGFYVAMEALRKTTISMDEIQKHNPATAPISTTDPASEISENTEQSQTVTSTDRSVRDVSQRIADDSVASNAFDTSTEPLIRDEQRTDSPTTETSLDASTKPLIGDDQRTNYSTTETSLETSTEPLIGDDQRTNYSTTEASLDTSTEPLIDDDQRTSYSTTETFLDTSTEPLIRDEQWLDQSTIETSLDTSIESTSEDSSYSTEKYFTEQADAELSILEPLSDSSHASEENRDEL